LNHFFPERVQIEAYGDGGFRFAHLSHRGSLLILPSGMHAWAIKRCADLTPEHFEPVFAEASGLDFLILGTGQMMQRPPKPVTEAFGERGIALDFMDTGAAIRTFNMLLAERRAVSAALIAVGTVR
jgi:uncharacterized protein